MRRSDIKLRPGEVLELHENLSNDELQTALNEAHKAFNEGSPCGDDRLRKAALKHYKELAKIQLIRADGEVVSEP